MYIPPVNNIQYNRQYLKMACGGCLVAKVNAWVGGAQPDYDVVAVVVLYRSLIEGYSWSSGVVEEYSKTKMAGNKFQDTNVEYLSGGGKTTSNANLLETG